MNLLIIYFIVSVSLLIAFFFIRWFVIKCAECSAKYALENAISNDYVNSVKAILITRSKRLSSEIKLDAQNWIDQKEIKSR